MWIIVGLGNPGKKYSRTRHNAGFMVIDEFSHKFNIGLKDCNTHRRGEGLIEKQKVILVEPLLYMNLSGPVIDNILKMFPIRIGNLLVIHDDLDIQLGNLKIKRNGSSGGHKGVESIIKSIGSKNFIRLKIGISRDNTKSAEDYVLSKFKRNEIHILKDIIHKSVDAIYTIVTEGVEKAMNKFN